MPDFPPSSRELARIMALGRVAHWNVVDNASHGFNLDTDSGLFLRDNFTLTNPGTSATSVFSITGMGHILGLIVAKPATVNSVSVNATLIVDGVTLVNDASVIPSAGTGARAGPLVGILSSNNAGLTNLMLGGPAFVPFHRSVSLTLRYSGVPGAGENITGSFCLVYS